MAKSQSNLNLKMQMEDKKVKEMLDEWELEAQYSNRIAFKKKLESNHK